jgi:hypothetical protein
VVAGQETLTSALNSLKADASFRVIGDMPVSPLLRLLGIGQNSEASLVEDVPVTELDETAV